MIDTDKYAEVIDDDGYFCEDRIADLLAEVKRLRGIIGYIRDTGRLDISNDLLPSIMEKVLTTEEYLEWRNKE